MSRRTAAAHGDALRGALLDSGLPLGAALVLTAWTIALALSAGKLFRWS